MAYEADPAIVRALCTGCSALPCVAHVVRGAVPPDACRRLAERFWGALELVGSHREDDGYVHVQQVGASQFGKSAADYVEQSLHARPVVESLFAGLSAEDRSRILGDRWLAPHLARGGVAFGPARILGVDVGPCTARSWRNGGPFSLAPHEDFAQLLRAVEEGLEIGAADPLSAWVCCAQSCRGGELVLWDLAPDHPTRARLGLEGTGYPYPTEALRELPRLEIPLRPGDCVLFRADFVHAVNQVEGPRVSFSRFLGAVGDRVLYWT